MPRGQLALDRCFLGSLIGDDTRLLGLRLLQLSFAGLDLGPERACFAGDARVLVGYAIDRVHAVQQVVQARRTEKDLEGGLVIGGVERDQTLLEEALRPLVVRACYLEAPLVHFLLRLDRIQLDLRGVVGLHDLLQIGVDRLDLGENLPCLRALRPHR